MLRFGQIKEGANRLVEVPAEVASVLRNANDFVFALRSDAVLAEALAEWILGLEELPRKRFVDDGHVP